MTLEQVLAWRRIDAEAKKAKGEKVEDTKTIEIKVKQ